MSIGIKTSVLNRIARSNGFELEAIICSRDIKLSDNTTIKAYKYKKKDDKSIHVCDLTKVDFNNIDSFDVLNEFDEDDEVIYVLENGNLIPMLRSIIATSKINQRFMTNDEDETINIEFEYPEENYLEYKKDKYKCITYNISLEQMVKLFDKIGLKIFDFNVRYYIEKEKPLLKEFKNYFLNYIEEKHKKLLDNENIKSIFKEANKNSYNPSMFWVCHNGITVCTNKILTNANHLCFEKDKTYILNGCQSIMTFVDVLNELKKAFSKTEEDTEGNSIIEQFCKEIIFKVTIIIEENINRIKHYSYCLNTQRPIEIDDIYASSKEAKDISDNLKNIKILKPGAPKLKGNKIGLKVRDFIKLYYNYCGWPGKSKNYVKNELDEDIKKINEEIKEIIKKGEDISKELEICYYAQKRYSNIKANSNERIIIEDDILNSYNYLNNNDCIDSFGANYFSAYCRGKVTEINDKDYYEAFIKFKKAILKYCYENHIMLDFQDFKKQEIPENSKRKTYYQLIFCQDEKKEANSE